MILPKEDSKARPVIARTTGQVTAAIMRGWHCFSLSKERIRAFADDRVKSHLVMKQLIRNS
jgi:hypothetical protein